jgi:hypothetical protein
MKNLCKEVPWLDLNANECKQCHNMDSFKMNMFGWKKNLYKFFFMVNMYHIFALIYV